MSHAINMTGLVFGRLTVLHRLEHHGHGDVTWVCRCICSQEVQVRGDKLRGGLKISCGCQRNESIALRLQTRAAEIERRKTAKKILRDQRIAAREAERQERKRRGANLKHGHNRQHQRTRTNESWHSMLQRTSNPNHHKFHIYGAAGVTVYARWDPQQGGSFANFLADLGERPEGTTLGRKGDVGNYEPGNCEWQTRVQQLAEQRLKRAA